ncbi:MAG: tetratricopeptide repeat protein [Candidatus Gastranaerophilales bacterium]|nr:tetratricopeptide repeat protein [Candidatus Gastranaerophilales bacterium]
MHKSLLVVFIVFVSLVCTACVNRFAVQELNNNAKELLSQGKVDAAIARLESSIDLDESIFETHYNLAVAYIEAKKYDKALASLEKVKQLNPDFAEAYHSMGVCYEEKAYEIINEEKEDKKLSNDDEETAETSKKELSTEDKIKVTEYLTAAIDSYNAYLTKKENAEDKEKVEQKIDELNKKIKEYSDSDSVKEENE